MTAQQVTEARKHSLIIAGIVLAALALRLLAFRGFSAVDDAAYAKLAYQMAQGTFTVGAYDGPPVFPLRVGILLPTAAVFRSFGTSEWSMVLFPLTLSLASILLAYASARHFFGSRAGLIAACLWAILPVDVFYASILVPDLPAAFFASAAVIGILLLADSAVQHRPILLLGGAAAGVCFGLSWLCKESVVYLVPFCIVLMIMTGKKDKRKSAILWAGVAAGAFVIFFSETTLYHNVTGDWLYRFHETEKNYLQNKNAFFIEGGQFAGPAGSSHVKAIVKRLFLTGPSTILFNYQFLGLTLLATGASLHALHWRNKSFLVPCLWFFSLVLMFNFSSSSLSSYAPLVLLDRYLYPVLLPAVVLTSGFLALLLFRADQDKGVQKERIFWGIALLVVVALTASHQNYRNIKWYSGWVSEAKAVSRILKPSDRLYTDILSIHSLEFFWRYPDAMQTVNFEDLEPSSTLHPGSFVLINRTYLDWLSAKAGWWPTKSEGYKKPEFHARAPAAWQRVWENGNAVLYQIP